jgi:hypothetical protein
VTDRLLVTLRSAPTSLTCAALCCLLSCGPATPALADARQLSLMPDPRGEFIRLCAPFMMARYAQPEGVCDCLRNAMFKVISDTDVLDALLYGVTERGVPTLSRSWLQPEKWPLIEPTMTAIAEPTMQCMFDDGHARRVPDPPRPDGPPSMPPVQDLTP